MNDGYEQFADVMRELWPSCRQFQGDGLLEGFFRSLHADIDEVLRCARKLRTMDWDCTKPSLKQLKQMLMKATDNDRDEWQAFLDSVRRGAKANGVKCENWSDRDVYEAFVETQARTWTHGIGRRLKDDPKGRLQRLAQRERTNWAAYWRGYLTEQGRPIPEWLTL